MFLVVVEIGDFFWFVEIDIVCQFLYDQDVEVFNDVFFQGRGVCKSWVVDGWVQVGEQFYVFVQVQEVGFWVDFVGNIVLFWVVYCVEDYCVGVYCFGYIFFGD